MGSINCSGTLRKTPTLLKFSKIAWIFSPLGKWIKWLCIVHIATHTSHTMWCTVALPRPNNSATVRKSVARYHRATAIFSSKGTVRHRWLCWWCISGRNFSHRTLNVHRRIQKCSSHWSSVNVLSTIFSHQSWLLARTHSVGWGLAAIFAETKAAAFFLFLLSHFAYIWKLSYFVHCTEIFEKAHTCAKLCAAVLLANNTGSSTLMYY